LRIDANQQTPQSESGPSTIAELVAHYRLKELAGDSNGRKAFSTRDGYECYLDNWILPRWQDHKLNQVKPVAVEAWLDSIKRARGTRAKIRNIMSAVFHHAMRYEWLDANRSSSCGKAQSENELQMFWNLRNYNFFSPNSNFGRGRWSCLMRQPGFA